MTWITTIEPDEAEGRLQKSYSRIKGPDGQVDNILKAHSLRPHTLDGHMALYKAVMHHSGNQVSSRLLEAIGVYVSHLNGCAYCVEHHYAGLCRLLNDDERGPAVRQALEAGKPETAFEGPALAALNYAAKLTLRPGEITEADIEALRSAGLSDGEILEINQVAAYFSYANRTVLGLGVSLDGEARGQSPSDASDPGNWSHR
ncbi:MAG: peroxidase-related enzyme [Sphingomonadales bacterium]